MANSPSGALPANRFRWFSTGDTGCVGGHRAGELASGHEGCRGSIRLRKVRKGGGEPWAGDPCLSTGSGILPGPVRGVWKKHGSQPHFLLKRAPQFFRLPLHHFSL